MPHTKTLLVVEDVKLATVGWKGAMSLRAYVDQYDTVHMLRLLGGDLTKFGKSVAHSHFAPSIRGYRNKKTIYFCLTQKKINSKTNVTQWKPRRTMIRKRTTIWLPTMPSQQPCRRNLTSSRV